jgi:hypothetical protein
MASNRPIDRLVQRVEAAILRSNALFGFVFEVTSDGLNFLRGCPLAGTIRDEAILRQYFKQIGNEAVAARLAGENRSIEIKIATEISRESTWYASIITQRLDVLACIAVVFQARDEKEAAIRLREFESVMDVPQFEEKDAVEGLDISAKWDRILETCIKNDQNAILVVRFPPFLRSEHGLRPMKAPVITAQHLSEMVKDIAPASDQILEIPGLRLFDVKFGESYEFRIAVLAHPDPGVIIVTRLQGEAMPLLACNAGWLPSKGGPWIGRLKECIVGNEQDVILVKNAPPLTWGADGLHAVSGPILTSADIRSCIGRTVEPADQVLHPAGYLEFGLSLNGKRFRAAMFDQPSSTMLVLLRLRMPELSVGAS